MDKYIGTTCKLIKNPTLYRCIGFCVNILDYRLQMDENGQIKLFQVKQQKKIQSGFNFSNIITFHVISKGRTQQLCRNIYTFLDLKYLKDIGFSCAFSTKIHMNTRVVVIMLFLFILFKICIYHFSNLINLYFLITTFFKN